MIRKSKPAASSNANLKKKLDRTFSLFIRVRDVIPGTKLFRCISCNHIKPIKQADCGHYINRQHMSTRFSEINCNAQCKNCNRFDEGNIQGYRAGLIRKYGEAKTSLLEVMKKDVRKYTSTEYEYMIDHYKKETESIMKEKGLSKSDIKQEIKK